MCLRYAFCVTDANRLMDRFALDFAPETLKPRYNIAPSQKVPVIFDDRSDRIDEAVWGIPARWSGTSHPLFNARAETVAVKPSFRKDFHDRRCLMLADAFYEWKKPQKRPFRISLESGEPFAFAGIYHEAEGLRTCCMLTCPSNSIIGPIHDRMHVILPEGLDKEYLEMEVDEASRLLVPYPSSELRIVELTDRINSSKSDSKDLVEVKAEGGSLARFMG